jgi:hypothetical protein
MDVSRGCECTWNGRNKFFCIDPLHIDYILFSAVTVFADLPSMYCHYIQPQ